MSNVHAPNVINMKYIESLLGKGDKFKAIFGFGSEKHDRYFFHLDENVSLIV
jgi:hypothetical protein